MGDQKGSMSGAVDVPSKFFAPTLSTRTKELMANITEEHLHHMARRHHATMKKLDGMRDKFAGFASKSFSTLETAAGAWAGGVIEGRTGGAALGPIPVNLGVGALLLVAGHLDLAGDKFSEHFNNIGNGFIGSYLAATGYAFGKRWKDTKQLFGGGGHPFARPYEEPSWQAGAPAVHGDLSQAQMADIVQRMQQAAAAPAQ
jgi:hypothetical protein